MTVKSKIKYLINEKPIQPIRIDSEKNIQSWSFEEKDGRIIVQSFIKLDIHNTGVNVLTVYGKTFQNEEVPVFILDTEGAYFYTYDGNKKCKLNHFESDIWYSIYLSVDFAGGEYALYIDGEQSICGALISGLVEKAGKVSTGSHGGIIYIKKLQVYSNIIQNVYKYAQGKMLIDAKEMGVCCDGVSVVTRDLQRLIDEMDENGGILYLKDGVYLTGGLCLKKNVTLYIAESAVLKGVLDINEYPVRLSKTHENWNTSVQGPQKALIYADSQENIQIVGGGCIDGSGDFPGEYGSESLRVSAILMAGCNNVEIGDIYVKDAGMWTIPMVECDNLYMHDINIYSTWYPNRDGIDICDCHDALIENCNVKADDDAVCFKSGSERGCKDVIVRDCMIISTMANGIKYGTYSYGGFMNCLCEDCIVKDTRTCAITIQSVDGGYISDLEFRRIVIQNVESVFFVIIADKDRVPNGYMRRIGNIENIRFYDIEASGVRRNYGSYLGGYANENGVYRIKNMLFENVNVIYQGGCMDCPDEPREFEKQYPESNCFGVLPAAGYYIRHAENIKFINCETIIALPDVRKTFYVSDADNIVVNGMEL